MDKLRELHQEFMDQKKYSERLHDATLRGYQQSFDRLMKKNPNLTLNQLTPDTMNNFFRLLDTETRTVGRGTEKLGVKASTIETYRSKLNTFFEWLLKQRKPSGEPKYISINPFSGIKHPDVKYEDRRWLKHEEIEKILSAVILNVDWLNEYSRKRNIAIIMTLLFTGIRSGELVGLHLTDIDFERRLLTISDITSKSKRYRIIAINQKLLMALQDFLQERKKRKLTTPYLFASSIKDERFTANGLKNVLKQISKASGVKFHAHRFRHTFAINMSLNGTDIYNLKLLLGHQHIDMTTRYLRHMPDTRMRANIDALTLDSLA